ncbi:hypothetical protein Emed_000919 [Eimeria media]
MVRPSPKRYEKFKIAASRAHAERLAILAREQAEGNINVYMWCLGNVGKGVNEAGEGRKARGTTPGGGPAAPQPQEATASLPPQPSKEAPESKYLVVPKELSFQAQSNFVCTYEKFDTLATQWQETVGSALRGQSSACGIQTEVHSLKDDLEEAKTVIKFLKIHVEAHKTIKPFKSPVETGAQVFPVGITPSTQSSRSPSYNKKVDDEIALTSSLYSGLQLRSRRVPRMQPAIRTPSPSPPPRKKGGVLALLVGEEPDSTAERDGLHPSTREGESTQHDQGNESGEHASSDPVPETRPRRRDSFLSPLREGRELLSRLNLQQERQAAMLRQQQREQDRQRRELESLLRGPGLLLRQESTGRRIRYCRLPVLKAGKQGRDWTHHSHVRRNGERSGYGHPSLTNNRKRPQENGNKRNGTLLLADSTGGQKPPSEHMQTENSDPVEDKGGFGGDRRLRAEGDRETEVLQEDEDLDHPPESWVECLNLCSWAQQRNCDSHLASAHHPQAALQFRNVDA